MFIIFVIGIIAFVFGLYLLALHYHLVDQVVSVGAQFFTLVNSLDNPFVIGIILTCMGFVLLMANIILMMRRKP